MTRQSILVVDDDEKVLEAVKDVLEAEGYVVHITHAGASGISESVTRLQKPLPVLGFELARETK